MVTTVRTTKTYTYRQIGKIAFPILVSLLMEQLIGMTDTIFLGRVNEVALGASALGGIFYITVFMIGMGFSIGAQILMGRRNGEGQYLRIGSIFYHSLAFLLLLAVGVFLLTHALAPTLLERIVSSQHVLEATWEYLQWRIYGFFFSFIALMFRAFYVGTTQTKTLTLNSTVMVLSNVVFNYALIFGNFGLPAFGIAGAAMGSAMAEGVSMVFFILYTRYRMDYRKYGLDRLPRFRFSVLKRILNLSVWTMVQNFVSLSTWFLFFLAVEHLGERQLAVTNIIRNVSAFGFMTISALASTASTLVSNLMGQRETEAIPPLVTKIVKLGFMLMAVFVTVVGLLPDAVLHIFTDEETLVSAGRASLYVLISSYVVSVPAHIYFQSISGTGNARPAFAMEMTALTFYIIYIIGVVVIARADVAIGWFSEHVYSGVMLLLAWLYFRSGRWKSKRL